MTTFIIRRILISIPVFIGITLLVFTFVAIAPGDVADGLIRPELNADPRHATRSSDATGWTSRCRCATSRWLSNALQGSSATAAMNGTPIADEVGRGPARLVVLTGHRARCWASSSGSRWASCLPSASTRSSTSC